MEQILKMLKSLSDKNRLKIFLYMLINNGINKCVNEIAADINLKQYCVSKSLKEFKSAELIAENRLGQKVFYHFNRETSDLSRNLVSCFERVGCSEKILSEDLEPYLKVFKVLSDKNRMKILLALLKKGEEKSVHEIVEETQLHSYSVSRGLKELKNAELIEERKDGRNAYYKIRGEQNCFARVTFIFLKMQSAVLYDKTQNEAPNVTL